MKQNTVFCLFFSLLSFIFENLLPQLYFSKKTGKKKKNSPNLKNVYNEHLEKTGEGIAQEIAKLEFISY